ncbi:GAF domain-containing protein [Galbibacter sp. EGI 63066]|uniref:GAF domain-containing protein n=1 Tax=Galbibacter sp. EGI 63066 TaxID=2993559 RepID=UPI002248EBDF|nr:GAF domain-containing protein [Galbibacter sp. EGI 63066]MCX2679733.1 GAF domain-containing protein [Galbibacter sp. EGI 63066]
MNQISDNIPFKYKVSFKKLFDEYAKLKDSANPLLKAKSEKILSLAKKHPEFSNGNLQPEEVSKHKQEVQFILEDLFPPMLTNNEIKVVTLPLQSIIFSSSKRFDNILKTSGCKFEIDMTTMSEDQIYILACSIILSRYYGYDLKYETPLYFRAIDQNKTIKHYRILYNGDFMNLYPTEKAKDITENDIKRLLKGYNDVSLWKEMFPPGSWVSEGFIIANMYDSTIENSISDLKTNLLSQKPNEKPSLKKFENIFQTLFNLPDLKVGMTLYNKKDNAVEHIIGSDFSSYILNDKTEKVSVNLVCNESKENIMEGHYFYAVPDIDELTETSSSKVCLTELRSQGFRSVILTPVISNNELIGVLELVSKEPYALNTVNANKLMDIMPYIRTSVNRYRVEQKNRIEAIIQKECTSIHQSVYWRFEQEAKNYLKQTILQKKAVFGEIVFDEVYPLYGQIDIKNSSTTRNRAIQKDLIIQLSKIMDILEVLDFDRHKDSIQKTETYIENISTELKSDSEQTVLIFIKTVIRPILDQAIAEDTNKEATQLIDAYFNTLENNIIYSHRKNYDKTVAEINDTFVSVLDERQKSAQSTYPHFFEMHKTDGVEHNMYIGESITEPNSFELKYLYSLRFWQLQVICEMERKHAASRNKMLIDFDVSSLILVYNIPMAIRFRMDEKHFDVDGAYNARYEILKTRIDKALIESTNERITKPYFLTIVYSHYYEEREYLEYIHFLQEKKILTEDVEVVELARQQGISGLKAIRVGICHDYQGDEFYDYDEILKVKVS